ncbi:MAG: phospholipase D-like domain-containing protein, partial [Pseudomonadota bacterium]
MLIPCEMASVPFFRPAHNCWKVEHASEAALLVDGEDYFRAVRAAMMKAKKRIVLLSWDLDVRVEMHDTQHPVEGPLALGPFIDWLVKRNPDLHVYILRWDVGALKALGRGLTAFTLIRWTFHPRIHLKLDAHHPPSGSVHRKVITIDEDTAFCGGIDITESRWDTREHQPENPRRAVPGGSDKGPWHDASMVVRGDVATRLAAYSVDRWKMAGGKPLMPADPGAECWPDALEPQFSDLPVAVARTEPEMNDQDEVREVEQLFLDMIADARRWIYAESQYFASDAIAEALERRLAEPDCPEFVLINPVTADGAIEGAIMQPQRAVLLERMLRGEHADKFRVYHPVTPEGSEIYCHAKIMIVDNAIFRIGSANMNNRSMGFDSECDLAIHADGDPQVEDRIAEIRNDLLAEHLAQSPETVAQMLEQTGSVIETIETLSSRARDGGLRSLRPYRFPDHNPVERWIGE